MPVRRLDPIRDESGFTLIELLVGTAAGLLVTMALVTVLFTSMHETARVTSRVDATQRARIVLYKMVDELHSACVAPQIAPVRKESTGTSLSFIHQTGSAVAPTPILSTVSLSGTTLSQSDYASTGGTVPNWTFASTPSATRQLMTRISPPTPGGSIFTYYAYLNGDVSATPLTTPLSAPDAARAVQVGIGLTAAPGQNGARDANAPATIQNNVLLRFTPATFNTAATNLPCQ
jgi:hypothetical protein